jgi:hypothetical protein
VGADIPLVPDVMIFNSGLHSIRSFGHADAVVESEKLFNALAEIALESSCIVVWRGITFSFSSPWNEASVAINKLAADIFSLPKYKG